MAGMAGRPERRDNQAEQSRTGRALMRRRAVVVAAAAADQTTMGQSPQSSSGNSSEDLRIQLKITSDPANLAPVREAVEDLCERRGFDEIAVGEIGLCVNEALANVMRHAYDNATDRPI